MNGNTETKGERMKEYTLEFLSEEFSRHIEQIAEEEERRSREDEYFEPMKFNVAKALKVIVDEIIALKKEKA